MYTESYLRYLLSDDTSLQKYYERKEVVTLEDIKRNLMLLERDNNHFIPDHYYRLGKERSFEQIDYVSQLFTVGLSRLAEEYLEARDNIVYVKAEKMNCWQLMLPYMPPLLMVCVKLFNDAYMKDGDEEEYLHKYIRPNLTYTAFPSPYIPQMREFLDEGLADLHMHLNGAMETDLTWQDFLKNPLEIKGELEKAYGEEKVKEQYAQSSFLADPDKFYHLLKVAARLRYKLYTYAFDKEDLDADEGGSLVDYLHKVVESDEHDQYFSNHPLELILSNKYPAHYMEAVLYIKLLQLMTDHPENDTVGCLFHYYLLILGLANKMMVQQPTCYGFEEFQKITMNGLREYSEGQNYYPRYAQLAGNQLKFVRFLEGRFSPKDTLKKNDALIGKILDGWDLMKKNGTSPFQLKLVAHFIKKREGKRDQLVRYRFFRSDLNNRAELLKVLLRNEDRLSKAVIGIDAAASEFDTPPEVFAPVYRGLREAGFKHFTYHAGEDFFHVLSGLRAIYEAITYLDLRRCDRIGHATAAGVPVGLWYQNVGKRMLIRRGEYLDNLIFAYHLIAESGEESLKSLLPMISLKIDEHSAEIYHNYYPVSLHIKAWQARYHDPEVAMDDTKPCDDMGEEKALFLLYHRKDVADRYDEIIEISTYDVLGEEQLTQLQMLLLKEMQQREIVIETLPTSNVIIGNHHDYSTYHLYNWYRWKKMGKALPPIVVGTDDTGIFATNIYNEYCNIYCQFLYYKGENTNDIMTFLRELNTNARHYAFT